LRKKFAILILLLFILTSSISAQQYKLNIGDQINISVWGHEDLSQQTSVNPDGEISYPLVGSVTAEGKTTEQLKKELSNSLSEYIIDPVVNINLISYRKLNVIVMGEVKKEGSFQLRADNTLLDVISLAGGITDMAKAEETTLQRNGERIDINLDKLLKGSNLEENYVLQNGDQIYVPQKEIKRASIQGEVKAPGSYVLEADREIHLNDFLAEAGSITENAADVVKIISENKAQEYKLTDTLAGLSSANPIIKDGDSVYVPTKLKQVTILGEIKQPGTYPYQDGMRLANLIAEAGSVSDRANLENIRLASKNGNLKEINMDDFFEDNKLNANPELQAGDLVMVGEKDSVNWSDVFFMFSGFNGIKEFFDISW